MKEKKNLPSLFHHVLLWGKKYMPRLLKLVVEEYAGASGEVSQWPKRQTTSVDCLLGLFFFVLFVVLYDCISNLNI
jgi:hypothetical protein